MSRHPSSGGSPVRDAATHRTADEDEVLDPDSPTDQFEADQDLGSTQRAACDNCRRRKVRCNRRDPCVHCRRTSVPCIYPASALPREKRRRVHISRTYEHKIDQIEARLDQVVQLLNQRNADPLVPKSNEVALRAPVVSSSCTISQPTGGDGITPVSGPEFEGEPSLTSHAEFASSFLHKAVGDSLLNDSSLELIDALHLLRLVLDRHKHAREPPEIVYRYARPTDPAVALHESLPMPPLQMALEALQSMRDLPRLGFFWFAEFQTIEQFTSHLLKVYLHRQAASTADEIIVNAGLYWTFRAFNIIAGDRRQTESHYDSGTLACRGNLETLLSRLPFHLPVSVDYATALLLAANYCLDLCKPSVAWGLAVAASQMAQALGCHSAVKPAHESRELKEQKTRLFWSIYLLEKSLSLRLGRSSTIREQDITVDSLTYAEPTPILPNPLMPRRVALATIQGQIYDQIYSPRALSQASGVRAACGIHLANQLQKIPAIYGEAETGYMQRRRESLGEEMHQVMSHSDAVVRLSILTLIYRAIPAEKPSSSIFVQECITAARDALREHQKCVSLMAHKASDSVGAYIRWVLLSALFTPFIVLFCHVIETCDRTDLDSLFAFTATLQSNPSSADDSSGKQQRLFNVLFNVAAKYVEVKSKTPQSQAQQQATLSLGMYLHALGLTPAPQIPQNQDNGQPQSGQVQEPEPAAFLHAQISTIPIHHEKHAAQDPTGHDEWLRHVRAPNAMDNISTQPDAQGVHLGDWFCGSQQMLSLLEEDYL